MHPLRPRTPTYAKGATERETGHTMSTSSAGCATLAQQRKEPDMRHATAVLVMAVAMLAASCSGGGSGTTPEPATQPTTTTTVTEQPTGVPACTSFDGQPVDDVANYFQAGNPCGMDIGLAQLETTYVGVGDRECDDGTFLYWNDGGWGRTAGTWTYSDVGLPPDTAFAACNAD